VRQPQPDAAEANALIAPGEIQELVARITEQRVEGVPMHQSRTLEGLAVETGIPYLRLQAELAQMRARPRFSFPPAALAAGVLMAGYAYWIVNHKEPDPVAAPTLVATAPAAPNADLSGLSPLTAVTYGPDVGPEMVDTSFEPSHPVPDGLSFYATTGGVLWGAGDHRAKVIDKPLSAEGEEALLENVGELLRYVRRDAARRHLPLGSPYASNAKESYVVTLQSNSYYGSGGSSVHLPPPGADNDAAAERAIKRAAKGLVTQIQTSIRQWRQSKRDQGP
jgi:hypothetical protein